MSDAAKAAKQTLYVGEPRAERGGRWWTELWTFTWSLNGKSLNNMIARSLMRFHEGGKRADCKIVFKWLQKHQTIIIFTVRIWFKVKDSVNLSRLLRNGPCSFAHPCIKEIRISSLNAFSDFPSVLEKSHQQAVDQNVPLGSPHTHTPSLNASFTRTDDNRAVTDCYKESSFETLAAGTCQGGAEGP